MINSALASQMPSSFFAGTPLSSIHIRVVLQDLPTKLQMSFLPVRIHFAVLFMIRSFEELDDIGI